MPPQKSIFCGADFGSTIALDQWFLTCMKPFQGFDGETSPANQTHGKAFFFVTGINGVVPDRTILGLISRWAY